MNGNAGIIVEDNSNDVILLRRMLAPLHLDLVDVNSLDAAREKVMKYPKFRIAFVDLKLGNESAMPFIRWMQANHPSIPVIVLTGALMLTPDLMNELIESGVQRAYQKPLEDRDLGGIRNVYDGFGAAFKEGRDTWKSKTNWVALASLGVVIYALYVKNEAVALLAATQVFGFFFAT